MRYLLILFLPVALFATTEIGINPYFYGKYQNYEKVEMGVYYKQYTENKKVSFNYNILYLDDIKFNEKMSASHFRSLNNSFAGVDFRHNYSRNETVYGFTLGYKFDGFKPAVGASISVVDKYYVMGNVKLDFKPDERVSYKLHMRSDFYSRLFEWWTEFRITVLILKPLYIEMKWQLDNQFGYTESEFKFLLLLKV